MKASGDGPINDAKWAKWIEWTEQNKISWVLWSASDKNETCSVLNGSANKNGQWTDKDLKESVQQALARKGNNGSVMICLLVPMPLHNLSAHAPKCLSFLVHSSIELIILKLRILIQHKLSTLVNNSFCIVA